MTQEDSTFKPSTYYRHEKDKQPGSHIEDRLAREQEHGAGTLQERAEVLRNGNAMPEGETPKSLIDKMIDEGGPTVNHILGELQAHGWKLGYFADEVCEKLQDEHGLSEPAMVYALAWRLTEMAEDGPSA